MTLPARICFFASSLFSAEIVLPNHFSSKVFPIISLVIKEDESVGSAMAARITPVRFLFIDEVLQDKNASLPECRII